MSDLKTSPLESAHLARNARLVPFAGWNMPVQYTSIIDEHHAVRQTAGIFDISHMGQLIVRGANACAWLNGLLTNNLARLKIGEGQYTLMLNPQGGVIDDLIAYRSAESEYFLVVNASRIDEDFAWLSEHLQDGITLVNESEAWAGMAIQGPRAAQVFIHALPGSTLPPRNGIGRSACGGTVICRTGYTGEDGFEFFCPVSEAVARWDAFVAAGATPCGLGARDTLRLEMGYPLNGNDLSYERTPIEAGLGFFCALDDGIDYIGRDVLLRQKAEGTTHKLTALQLTAGGPPPRAHYPVLAADGTVIGELCSGALSPSLKTGIGMAYLPVAYTKLGTPLQIDVRGRQFSAEVVKKPFYRKTNPSILAHP
ncbi:MAG TPA: glycine cleavage system aminomethyltransferase GcvT [Luteolibacter sp.]|nr:glycine cleavage system aminomethyltransferase GcvT [Luteolibacter sp.]